jgi:Helix-turn-helix domain
MASVDLLLHPVRLRILQAFLGNRKLTTSELARELADVPAGSLYRQVAKLAEAGVLQVVAERRARGAVERTFALQLSAAEVGSGETAAMTSDEHRRTFMAFVAGLLGDFDRYLDSGTPDLARDGVGFRMTAMWLSDDEFTEFVTELAALFRPRLANTPGNGRRRRIAANIFLPAPEATQNTPETRRNP